MHRTRTSFALALALFVWTAPGFGAEDDASKPPQRLSAFRLQTLDLRAYSSAQQLRDRAALITFWRVDQEPSVRILKDLKRLFDGDTKQEIAIISIVAGAVERPLVVSVVKELEIAFPVLLDPERRVYAELGVIVSPTTWFIDRNGVLIDHYPGHRRDFLNVARINLDFLRGKISEAERTQRVHARSRPLAEEDMELAGGQTRYRLALRLLEKGRRGAAEEQLGTAWRGDPPMIEAGVTLGLLMLEDDRDAEALAILERVEKLGYADPLASGARGVALIRLGREQAGADLLRHALEQPVAEPLLYYEMAKLSERSGAADEARQYYRKGLELMLAERNARRGD